MRLRRYEAGDEVAAIALWLRSWQAAYPQLDFAARLDWWRERWRSELVPSAAIVIAEADGEMMREEGMHHRNLITSAVGDSETVRAFLGGDFLQQAWRRQTASLNALREVLERRHAGGRMRLETVSTLLRIGIYAIGAMLAVAGDMSVGGLIGASILSSKALMMSTSFLQSYQTARRAEAAQRRLAEEVFIDRER